MYDATLGRFLGRDPLGPAPAAGSNLYEYASDNPSLYVDPSGLLCCCQQNPGDCSLKYTSLKGADFGAELKNEGKGYEQEFAKRYYVYLVSKKGQDTCGCHILQAALSYKVYSNPADAKPQTPGAFGKPANEPGFFSFVVPFFPKVVVTVALQDYKPENTRCDKEKKQATINDQPGFEFDHPRDQKNRADAYGFYAYDYVQEAPSVNGAILITAQFNWPKGGGSWTATSSDQGVKEKGGH
jgi:hypothetical protein